MRSADNIEKQINKFNLDINADKDRQILNELLQAQENANRSSDRPSRFSLRRMIMQNKKFSLTTAATVIIAVLLTITFLGKTPQAWAIEETIKALKQYNGAYLSGVCPGQTGSSVGFELWVRTNDTGTSTKNVLVKLDDGLMVWTKDNATYAYLPDQNTVLYEDAVTTGFSHFLGPELFELLSSIKDARTTYGYDSATGRKRAMLSGGMTDVSGAKFLQVEFDVDSKLVVSIKQWDNLRPQGTPTFHAFTIRYFEQLPDSTFEVHIPDGVTYIEKPVTIPEANLKILSNPRYGISSEGLTKEQASREILEQLYNAILDGDLKRIRNLAPVTESWPDDLLKNLLHIEHNNEIVQVLEIGGISRESASSLGPIVVVPVTTKRKDGTVWLANCIIQFRQIDGEASCVVHGPQGLPVQLESSSEIRN